MATNTDEKRLPEGEQPRPGGRRVPRVVRMCAVLLLAGLVLFTVIQLMMPGRYDVSVLVAFEGALALEQREYLTEAIEQYAIEEESGRVANVELKVLAFDSISAPANQEVYDKQIEELQSYLSSGETILMVLDEPLFDYISRKGYLQNIATRYPNNQRVERYRFFLAESSFFEGELMANLPDEELSLCIRREDGVPLGIFNFNWPQRYAFALEVLDHIVAGESEA